MHVLLAGGWRALCDLFAGFEQTLIGAGALFHLAARDPAAHRLVSEVAGLLKPRSAYQAPKLREKLQRIMAER